MPFRRIPDSTPTVLRALRMARDQYQATTDVTQRAISSAQFAQLDTNDPTSLLSRLEKEVSEADNAQALQAPLTSSTGQKSAQLQMFVSHFHQALDNGIARGFFQAGARSYYGRDVSNPVLPPMTTYQQLAEAAAQVDTGETARSTAEGGGFQLMSNPSRDEVNTVAAEFHDAWEESKEALAKTDAEKEDVQALYPEAQAFAVDLADSIEFFFRKDKVASSRRVKCKRWGVVYVYGADETPDPEPGGTTPPPGP